MGKSKHIPKVGVVLVNWNTSELTIPCIESLCEGDVVPDRILVVDNGSEDDSCAKIKAHFHDIPILRLSTNHGFTGGSNRGIERLLGEGVDYVWVLNNDTLIEQDCLSQLLRAAEKHPEGCCFTGKIYYDNPPDKLWYAGGFRHWLHLCPKHLLDNSLDSDVQGGVVEVDFISGCCMLIPRSILLKYGAFILEYFAYAEDGEWCFRMKNAGKKLFYVPSAVLKHCVSASIRKNKGKQEDNGMTAFASYLTVRNYLWTTRKHASPFHKKFIALVIITGLAVKNMVVLLRYFQWSKIAAISKGAWHGLAKRLPHEFFSLNIKG